jgi:penicillin-binding protein 2
MREKWVYYGWYLVIVVSLLGLWVRLIDLSLIRGDYFASLARKNRIREKVILAPRGEILDRKGRVMAESVYQYFSVNEEGNRVYEEEGEFKGQRFEGENAAYELKRKYPYKESTAFLTGYVGRVFEDEIGKDYCGESILTGELRGRGGSEEWWDCQLSGKTGKRMVEVDAKEGYIRELGRIEPVAGKDVQLSVDAYWQEKIYQMIKDKKAVVVALGGGKEELKKGKILALVSSPSFDPNVFSYQQDDRLIQDWLDDRENWPLLNRAAGGQYHPGSVFKIVTATAGLETGKINEDTLIEDTGVIKVGEWSFRNWLWVKGGGTDGMVDIVKGIQRSNDIFFYKVGEMVGVEGIHQWAEKFGYGKKSGIELPAEISGLLPSVEWKKKAKGEGWWLGNTYHLAIGQGDLAVTPLQVAAMTSVIANDGVYCQPSLDKNSEGKCGSLGIKKANLDLIQEGMKKACGEGGTAWTVLGFEPKLACKTGTAEVGDGSDDAHAWFTVYAPADDPEIVLTVLLERGGEGSDVAAPIAGDILNEWFGTENQVLRRKEEN